MTAQLGRIERRSLLAVVANWEMVVTVPGQVFFLPNEVSDRIADVIVQALTKP